MKKVRYLIPLLIFSLILGSCSLGMLFRNPLKLVSEELGLNVSSGTVISDTDTHGGFLGDGYTVMSISFGNDSVLESISKDGRWQEFPLDETMNALVYDYLRDDDGNTLIPEINNGWHILIDHQTDQDTPILDRYSFNYTVGLYDTVRDILYYGRFDT